MTGRPWVEPVVLKGTVVRLEPLSIDHLSGLISVGLDADIWRWMPVAIQSPGDMRAYIDAALAGRDSGREMPFATVEVATGRVIGGTRYLNIESAHRRLEIGYTWLAPAWQRTAANTEQKLLMLAHAFNDLGALRVEFKTDSLNDKSRAALLGIGATEEGTMRNHMITQGGRRRHSVYFSVVEEDWPRIRQHLEARLARLSRSAAESQERPAEPGEVLG
jgi:N-acetyltransferase